MGAVESGILPAQRLEAPVGVVFRCCRDAAAIWAPTLRAPVPAGQYFRGMSGRMLKLS